MTKTSSWQNKSATNTLINGNGNDNGYNDPSSQAMSSGMAGAVKVISEREKEEASRVGAGNKFLANGAGNRRQSMKF